MRHLKITSIFLLLFISQLSYALNPSDLLRAEQAFKVSVLPTNAGHIKVIWEIADGYYLYRNKISVASKSDAIKITHIDLPAGIMKHDASFGDVLIYRDKIESLITLERSNNEQTFNLLIKHQGCADIGVCYPPQSTLLKIDLPAIKPALNPIEKITKNFNLALNLFSDELLPADKAFPFIAFSKDDKNISVQWDIAKGYYLYREKFEFKIIDENGTTLLNYTVPHGTPKYDEAFGEVELLYGRIQFNLALSRSFAAEQSITLISKFQGCAERGVCYPPMQKTVTLQLSALSKTSQSKNIITPETNEISEQDFIIKSLNNDSFVLTLFSFLGFGLLLAFTPCTFPMVPILSGIIIGQGKGITQRKAFLLSFSFVFASALTYTVFGILAALFGSNLQADFQAPWIIYLFSSIFVILALSMFDFYHIELPKFLQSRLHNASDSHRDGSYLGAALMGFFSSLIVGPCVAAPLAAALIYIGQSGDVLLGGLALFMMGMGMGVPLLLIGASAGKLLPKAGHWLNASKAFFGVMMLAVAVWMLDRVVAKELSLFLWALLCIIPAIYLRALEPLSVSSGGWQKLWKGTGLVLLIYGILMLVGLSAGNTNPLQPLKGITSSAASVTEKTLPYKRVSSLSDLKQELQKASQQDKLVMLDFYADWCISCKEMEHYTLSNTKVKQRLANFVLLQADVTQNNAKDKELLKAFNIIGPPAILFFDTNQQELAHKRVIGFQDITTFLNSIPTKK
ncbi:MAG: protein-disulfide reductase DsbD [Methyloprofundus sp.]|nr:protein-disulfide reductase DsbD [Methyloprofundus sp.]